MGNRADYVLEFGPEPKGTASTIVDLTSDAPKLLREGEVPFQLVVETWAAAGNH